MSEPERTVAREEARVTVLCIGNTLMGDDGVGSAVADELRRRGLSRGVELIVSPLADLGLVRHFRSAAPVIVVDGLDAGVEPGAVFRFTPDDAGITSLRGHNIHGMGVGQLVAAARLTGSDPDVTVFGVQVADVRPRADTLSAEVAEAVADVADLVMAEVARWLDSSKTARRAGSG